MSYIVKRQLSTLIPPKIASASNLGAAPGAKRLASVVDFYKALPRGTPAKHKPTTFIERYSAKYFEGDNASGLPLIHLTIALFLVGYTLDYQFHLKHHKKGSEEHH
ncbi:mitochondrial F1-F0 ATP synthase subunit F of fungi-domain-containing protein [Myxozyma melibiosi]|uniref:Mitochondrial F1-F0 ATP synthase subunit F of fungi-domain-containing protein n=1 Tax=Myxozyma melibiosi TaxID=54550 RepID=A0ABR1EZH6_9ASCO